jgi:hypothetical protein
MNLIRATTIPVAAVALLINISAARAVNHDAPQPPPAVDEQPAPAEQPQQKEAEKPAEIAPPRPPAPDYRRYYDPHYAPGHGVAALSPLDAARLHNNFPPAAYHSGGSPYPRYRPRPRIHLYQPYTYYPYRSYYVYPCPVW